MRSVRGRHPHRRRLEREDQPTWAYTKTPEQALRDALEEKKQVARALPPLPSREPIARRRKRLVVTSGGWYTLAEPAPTGSRGISKPWPEEGIRYGAVFLGEGSEGEELGSNRARFGKFVVDLSNKHTSDDWARKADFDGMDLSRDQRAAAIDVAMRYGRSYKPNYAAALLGGRVDLATGISTMPHTPREREVRQGQDVDIPSPPEAPNGTFVDFEKADAEALTRELHKLQGMPVVLSGGGGWGHEFVFLEGVKTVPNYEPVRGPDGKAIAKPGERPVDEAWYVEDRTKPPKNYSVRVYLRTFPGESDMGRLHTTRQLGSWKITALSGYGAEKVRKTWPPGWEE